MMSIACRGMPIAECERTASCRRGVLVCAAALMLFGAQLAEAREVEFPPPDSEPPPAARSPRRTVASGEDVGIIPDNGPTMRKTQERMPPPPTNLTVMYKLQYGSTLSYTYPDGRTVEFEQWESFKDDGYELMRSTNERLADGNNYQYATMPLASEGGFDPVDIPLLYMAGDYDFVFSDAEVRNLRKYLMDGGTIMFNAARGRDEFNRAVVRELRRVFPQKRFMEISPDHPIYNARYRIQQVMLNVNGLQHTEEPEIYALDIGTRAAAILIPDGMGTAWSGGEYHPDGRHLMGDSAVRMGVNVVAYVLGNTTYGRFLAQEFPVYQGETRPGDVLRFAIARYAGSWSVNPALQNRLMQGLYENTGIDVDFAPHVVALDDREIGRFPLLLMTGHYDFEFTDEEIDNLRDYLHRGGVVLASAAAGLRPFDVAFRREMRRVLPEHDLIRLPPSHPIFESGWNPLLEVEYTDATLQDDPTMQHPRFYGAFIDGRLAVIYTPFDLFTGVNREPNAYSKGLVPDDALRVAINAMAYVMTH